MTAETPSPSASPPEQVRASPPLLRRASAKITRLSSRLTQKLLLPFARELTPDRWIFILGCYNSGTSLLAKILSSHRLIGGLPDEGMYFTDVLPYPEQFGWPRMWIRCVDKLYLDHATIHDKTVSRIKRQWSLAYPKGSQNLVEKTPSNVLRMKFLQTHFEPAYFVAVVRNGYAVSEGIRRRAQPGRFGNQHYKDSYPLELCAEQWRASDEVITKERSGLNSFLQVRYEDLTEKPEQVLAQITEFLGLDPLPASILRRAWFVKDRMEPIRNMNAGSLARLSEGEFEIVENIAREPLRKYGYLRSTANSHSNRGTGLS